VARRIVQKRRVAAPTSKPAIIAERRDFLLAARVPFLVRSWAVDMESANRSDRYIGNVTEILEKWIWWAGHNQCERFDTNSLRGFLRYVQTGHQLPEGRWGEPGQTRQDHLGKPGYPINQRYSPVADSTVLDYYRRIRGWCSWLVKQDYLEYSPIDRVTQPLARSKPQFNVFSEDEVRRMEAAARKSKTAARDTALVLFLVDTGLRAEEVTTLTWSQVNMDKDEATFQGKGDKTRTVWWSREVGRALYAWRSEWELPEGTNGPVFPSLANRAHGGTMDRGGLRHLLARLGRVAKVERCNPHTFRHTCATMRALSGMEPFVLKEFLGHESIETTMKYIKFVRADLSASSRKHSPVAMLRRKR
jgi:integrase/recombinase XerD